MQRFESSPTSTLARHARGARGIRAPGRRRAWSCTPASTTRRSSAGAGRGGRAHLGRGNNDFPFITPGSADRRRRPAAGRARARLPPRRGQPADGRRLCSSTRSTAPPPSRLRSTDGRHARRPIRTRSWSAQRRRYRSEDGPPLAGKAVLVVEDGPTITHGGMPFGAGTVAAQQPAPASRSIRARGRWARSPRRSRRYPHIGPVLPAMGYSDQQLHELEATINATDCDVVIAGTPVDLGAADRLPPPDPPRHVRASTARSGGARGAARTLHLRRVQIGDRIVERRQLGVVPARGSRSRSPRGERR